MDEKLSILMDIIDNFPDGGLLRMRDFLSCHAFTSMELTEVALKYISYCENEYEVREIKPEEYRCIPSVTPVYSAQLVQVVLCLLQHGMNPNEMIDVDGSPENVMDNLIYCIDKQYAGANALRCCFEHGGDVNIMIEDERLFDILDFDIYLGATEQEIRDRYDCWVHCWFVFMGYGAQIIDSGLHLRYMDGFSAEMFRQHEQFDWRIYYREDEHLGWIMHIYNKSTKEVVAVY